MLPKLLPVRRQKGFGDAYQLFNELFRLWSKGQLDPFRRPKQISDNRVKTSLHPAEKDCRSAPLDHAAMNFGEFQVWIYFRVGSD
jgi:hypothetical protein